MPRGSIGRRATRAATPLNPVWRCGRYAKGDCRESPAPSWLVRQADAGSPRRRKRILPASRFSTQGESMSTVEVSEPAVPAVVERGSFLERAIEHGVRGQELIELAGLYRSMQ